MQVGMVLAIWKPPGYRGGIRPTVGSRLHRYGTDGYCARENETCPGSALPRWAIAEREDRLVLCLPVPGRRCGTATTKDERGSWQAILCSPGRQEPEVGRGRSQGGPSFVLQHLGRKTTPTVCRTRIPETGATAEMCTSHPCWGWIPIPLHEAARNSWAAILTVTASDPRGAAGFHRKKNSGNHRSDCGHHGT